MEFSNNAEYFFGNNLRFLRKERKLTLLNVSEALDVSKSAISDYENGKTLPGLDVVKKFSNFFNVPMDVLYNSDIAELHKTNTNYAFKAQEAVKKAMDFENEKYIFNMKIMTQKLESIHLQIQMLKQLLESKESENKTLRINIKLLEELVKS